MKGLTVDWMDDDERERFMAAYREANAKPAKWIARTSTAEAWLACLPIAFGLVVVVIALAVWLL